MSASHFELLLHAARSQPEPQRLLFVFAAADLPAEATAAQKSRFEAGEGGELEPVMVVDKDPHALTTFEALAAESGHTGRGWRVVFVAGLSGLGLVAPSAEQTEHALNEMVEAVRHGDFGRYVAYDVHGEPLSFS
jgi:hypothetical protein